MEERRQPTEDRMYLERWLADAQALAATIKKQSDAHGGISVFTIATTIKTVDRTRPYLTPLRVLRHGAVGGALAFSQLQARLLCRAVDGLVDWILVDAEKKIPVSFGFDEETIAHFDIEPPNINPHARVHVELGNLSAACAPYAKKSRLSEYKPNDITVEAVWHSIARMVGILSGKKVAIIGCGNVGFKLALKLVESGCSVEIVRRDAYRGSLMADTINIAKSPSTVAIAHYNPDPVQASLFCDVIIGCTNGTPAVTWEMVQVMHPDGIVIDVGKGTLTEDALVRGASAGVKMVRADVGSGIEGLIATMCRSYEVHQSEIGRREIADGVFVVSGGYMGLSGDVVVDNYTDPRRIIGVANGRGDLAFDLTDGQRCARSAVEELVARVTTV